MNVDVNTLEGTLVILTAGFLGTYVWRLAGVAVANRIREDALVLIWVKAVATALIAGLLSKIIFFAPGTLALVPLYVRLLSAVVALGFYFGIRRNLWLAILAGEAFFILAWVISAYLT